MAPKVLAHLSDLHLGRSSATEEAARRLCHALIIADVDHVVVTGDITHRGRCADLDRFFEIFAPLIDDERLTYIPGNHDRNGEACGSDLMRGRRVQVARGEGLHLVQVDTTAAHNRSVIASHGELTHQMLDEIDCAVRAADTSDLVAMLLHHHVFRLPVEGIGEWFADSVGWPNAEELGLGGDLIARVLGRADLILHGHRHIPREWKFTRHGPRPLSIYNAGSSTELGKVRLFVHDQGRVLWDPMWLPAASSLSKASPPGKGAPAAALRAPATDDRRE
jgi:3',5'-cyclic AMP phosphodiesterase CpdA